MAGKQIAGVFKKLISPITSVVNFVENTYGRGAGRIPDKQPCAKEERDDGLGSCWLDSYGRGVGRMPDKKPCAQGERDDVFGSCWLSSYGRGVGYPWKFGDSLSSKDARKRCEKAHGVGNCEQYGAIIYPKCKDGYTASGCCTCMPKGGDRITKNLFQRQSCKDDEEKWGALCYPKCKDGFENVLGNMCQPKGGPRITKNLFERQYCKDNEEKVDALCYPKCRDGYSSKGCCLCTKK